MLAARTAGRPVLIALFVALVMRVALLALLPESAFVTTDTVFYARLAENLLDGHGFSSAEVPPFAPSIERPPGYPVFLAAVWAIGGRSYFVLSIAQVLLDLAVVALVYAIGRRRFGPRVGFWAALIYGALPFTAGQNLQFMSEGLATFFIAVALYAHTRALDAPRAWTWALACGAAWGGAALARSYLAPLAAVAGVVLWIELARRRPAASKAFGDRLRSAGFAAFVAVGVSSACVVGSWVARNAYLAATSDTEFVLLEKFGSRDVYVRMYTPEFRAWYQSYGEPFYWVDWKKAPRANYLSPEEERAVQAAFAQMAEAEGQPTPETTATFGRIAAERYDKAPLRLYLYRPLSVALKFWLSPRASTIRLSMAKGSGLPVAGRGVVIVFFVLNVTFAGLALLGLIRQGRAKDVVFLLSFPLVMTAILTAIMHRESRLVMPLFPVVSLAAGIGLTVGLEFVRRRLGRAASPAPAR